MASCSCRQPAPPARGEHRELQDLHANLAEQGIDARTVPLVIQYNKQDLPRDLVSTCMSSTILNFARVPYHARRRDSVAPASSRRSR
jgi:hypothetical protein